MGTYLEYEPLFLKNDSVIVRQFVGHDSRGRVNWHEAIEILYFTQGSAVSACNLQEYKLKKGQFLLVNGNELHTAIISQVNSAYYMLQFDPAIIHNHIGNKYLLFNNIIKDETCSEIIEKLVKIYLGKKDSKDIIETKKLVLDLFSVLVDRHVKEVLDEETYKKQLRKFNTYSRIIEYIEQNYNQDINIATLSQHFSISPSYLSHIFKKHSQKSIIEYLNELRVSHAKEFLENEETSVSEIAIRIGFYDINYFSRKFKAITGKTPIEYRKLHTN